MRDLSDSARSRRAHGTIRGLAAGLDAGGRGLVRLVGGALIGGAVLASASSASARECSNPLINTCINSDTYWPNPGPMRFATVSGTETVAAGQVGFGLVTTYLSRPVLLHVASPGPGGSDQYVVNNQVNSNFLFAYGVTNRLELDIALPVTFWQTGAGTTPITGASGDGLPNTAIRDLRFGAAFAIIPRNRVSPEQAAGAAEPKGNAYSLTARFVTTAPISDADFAGDRTAVLVPSLSADYRIQKFFFGAELGVRIRPVTEFAGARVGTQLATGLGAGYDILARDRLSLMLEGRAYVNFAEQHDTSQSAFGISTTENGKHITPAEWFLGLRSAPILDGDVAIFGGGGGPIPIGEAAITVPRFRFILGVTYAPLKRDNDGDGVPDKNDRCPTRPGVSGGEHPGCPAGETGDGETKPQ
ncbi:hypothetical protein [Labilithrix luteola]|nr:hypothetical protein [Labilithrix luteola]